MYDFDDTTVVDITEMKDFNFQIPDGAQRYEDFDEFDNYENDDDVISIVSAYKYDC